MRSHELPTARRASGGAAVTSGTPAIRAYGHRRGPAVVLGRYRLRRRLGAGGFGTVWIARDERLERDVAIKILPRERIISGRFEREARAAARLAHPGIVTLYEAAVDDDGAYLVSELVRGATLDDLIAAGRLSDRQIVRIGSTVCDALAHAHAGGIVHRDVKPSNILVPDDAEGGGAAKLTDFGIARVIGGDSVTRTGEVVGTPAYMAPEQADGRPAGPEADLYSLALVMYEALTGVNPVRAGSGAVARRLGAYLPPLRRQRRDLPRELGQGVDLALRPRPRERGTLDELRGSLDAAADRVGSTAGVVGGAWPRRGEQPAEDKRARGGAEPAAESAVSPQRDAWPARAAAGIAGAFAIGWIDEHLLTPPPIAPAAAALLGGLVIAALPRIGWAAASAGAAGAMALQGHAGGGAAVLIAAAIPVALLPRRPLLWPVSVAAPALAAVTLAGAWPALAGCARTAWRRAALGITGWLWLLVATPLAGSDLYARLARGTPQPAAWMASLYDTGAHVLAPLAMPRALVAAGIWGIAAALLPHVRRGGSLSGDLARGTAWAAATAVATAAIVGPARPSPGVVVLGAVASGVIAAVPTAARRRPRRATSTPRRDFRSMDHSQH